MLLLCGLFRAPIQKRIILKSSLKRGLPCPVGSETEAREAEEGREKLSTLFDYLSCSCSCSCIKILEITGGAGEFEPLPPPGCAASRGQTGTVCYSEALYCPTILHSAKKRAAQCFNYCEPLSYPIFILISISRQRTVGVSRDRSPRGNTSSSSQKESKEKEGYLSFKYNILKA